MGIPRLKKRISRKSSRSLPAIINSPEPPPQRPQEEGSLPRDADEAAIAAGMKMASLLGIPFCEECARAALKRAREAAYA